MENNWWHNVQYGSFSLREFCDDALAMAKYLIRAREQFDPGFLGDAETYKNWHLSNIQQDPEEVLTLLRWSKAKADKVEDHMIAMGGSGGVWPEDPLGSFKGTFRGLVAPEYLEEAIDTLRRGDSIDWAKLASWQDLPEIRAILDDLYRQGRLPGEPDVVPPRIPIASSTAVQLFEISSRPVAIVQGNPVIRLTAQQFDVVNALLVAGPRGLSKDQLIRESSHSDAHNILKRLYKSGPPWADVIELAGESGWGYRIH